jgi:hypothetical protein
MLGAVGFRNGPGMMILNLHGLVHKGVWLQMRTSTHMYVRHVRWREAQSMIAFSFMRRGDITK